MNDRRDLVDVKWRVISFIFVALYITTELLLWTISQHLFMLAAAKGALVAIKKQPSKMKFTAIIVFTLVTVSTYGQTLSNEIDAIYNFQPGKLSDKEQESKFPALDSL